MLSHTPILAYHVDVPKASLCISSILLRRLGTRNEAQRTLAFGDAKTISARNENGVGRTVPSNNKGIQNDSFF